MTRVGKRQTKAVAEQNHCCVVSVFCHFFFLVKICSKLNKKFAKKQQDFLKICENQHIVKLLPFWLSVVFFKYTFEVKIPQQVQNATLPMVSGFFLPLFGHSLH